jgi:hypothetical protein
LTACDREVDAAAAPALQWRGVKVQAGEKLAVRVRGTRMDGSAHRHGAVAAFFAPGKDPEHVLADRVPDRQVPLGFDPVARVYGAEVRTDGWRPGTWTVQGTVLGPDGAPDGWAWYRFTLGP